MEGRESSSTGNVYPNHHTKPNSSSSDDEDEFKDLIDTHDDKTYVIQVPKDQIYRVPPPENAVFAEQKRNFVPKTNRSNCVLVSVLVLLLITAIILGICLAVADKADPTFRIHRIHVTTRGKGKQREHEFDFTLRSKNKNNHAVIAFQKGGKASLAFRHRSLAKCRFPTSEQGSDSLKYVRLKLVSGSGRTLPKVVEKSMNGSSHSTTSIKLVLGFNVPLRFKVGVFPVKSKRLSIVCNVKVKRLTNRPRILTQDCDYSATS